MNTYNNIIIHKHIKRFKANKNKQANDNHRERERERERKHETSECMNETSILKHKRKQQ